MSLESWSRYFSNHISLNAVWCLFLVDFSLGKQKAKKLKQNRIRSSLPIYQMVGTKTSDYSTVDISMWASRIEQKTVQKISSDLNSSAR